MDCLRTVPTIVIVHTFCASRDTQFLLRLPMGGAHSYRDIFVQFNPLTPGSET